MTTNNPSPIDARVYFADQHFTGMNHLFRRSYLSSQNNFWHLLVKTWDTIQLKKLFGLLRRIQRLA